MPTIGRSVIRLDAQAKVTGEALYPGDINLPDQAYMKILFAKRPHAIVKQIDTSQAEALPGVIAVFTAKDVPVNEYGLIMPDQPVLCGPGSSKPYTDRVRWIGDQVALVVAETEELAAQGTRSDRSGIRRPAHADRSGRSDERRCAVAPSGARYEYLLPLSHPQR